ncbi:hypothetical protein D3C87_1411180 [compost metagenome]|jgi:transposase
MLLLTKAMMPIIYVTGLPTVAQSSSSRQKRNRKVECGYDADLYKERNRIKRLFNKLKQFRCVATR